MKTLLILGDNTHSDSLIRLAKGNGIYTIITDNKSPEESDSKLIADEYWDISVTDIDMLEKMARKANVTAVLCGASELCFRTTRDLCKRLDLTFWINDKAWDYSNDKRKFKELCKSCGLPVAKDFELDNHFKKQDLEKIEYPVVVKPVDGCSSLGMHVCSNEEELLLGYKDALSNSIAKKVVVEKYYSGIEIGLIYFFKDGKAHFFNSVDFRGYRLEAHPMIFGLGPTNYDRHFEEEWKPQIDELFLKLECKNGVGFIQILTDGKDAAVMEMNYRLPGGHLIDDCYLHKYMLDCAFGEEDFDSIKAYVPNPKQSFRYFVWLKPGTISNIEGVNEIKSKLDVISFKNARKKGDTVCENTGMKQIFVELVVASEIDRIPSCVGFINDTLKVTDANGNDMVCRYDFIG